jgi:hypothetical protein
MKVLAKVPTGFAVFSVLLWGMPHFAAATEGNGHSHDNGNPGAGDTMSNEHTGNFGGGSGGDDTHP